VALGVIPLGTGNDFSQHLGWGKEKTTLTENGYRSLKKLIRKWLVAEVEEFDLWRVRAEIYEVALG
jgi:diacylglycerol kinase (ATP)